MRVYILGNADDLKAVRLAAKAERRSVSSFCTAVVLRHVLALPHHGAWHSETERANANRKITRRA